jgi:hypothetical protein
VHLSDLYRRLLAQSISSMLFFGAATSTQPERSEMSPILKEAALAIGLTKERVIDAEKVVERC